MLNVTFFGVRATPLGADQPPSRYGGQGPCVALEVPEGDAILLDLGTGAARWAATVTGDRPVRVSALVTRAHRDHVAGLPLFEGEVFGPPPGRDAVGSRWVVVEDEDLAVGDAKVTVRSVPHAEPVNGYRVEWQGVTVAYVSVQQGPPAFDTVAEEVLELAEGADLLVHGGSGGAPIDYPLLVARQGGARVLALCGHRLDQDDDALDRIMVGARRTAARLGVDEVLVAAEGTTVSFERGVE